MKFDLNKIKIISLAIKSKEIKPYLQPIVDFNNRIKGFEALSRWVKNEHEVLLPYAFIEDIKADHQLLDEWTISIIEQLICFLMPRKMKLIDLHLNIYSSTLNTTVIERIICLNKYVNVVIEIIEDDIIYNEDEFIRNLDILSKYGVKLAIDDFGCGFNNESRLYKYKFDFIKIDRSLTSLIDVDIEKYKLIKRIKKLSDEMGTTIIAEGVETIEQAKLLKGLDINRYQGFLYYKALPLEIITELQW